MMIDTIINISDKNFVPVMRLCHYASVTIVALTLIAATEQASAHDEGKYDAFSDYLVLNDEMLDSLRGGFVTSDGLEINVGLEKMVFINDVLQSKFVMDLSQLKGRIVEHDIRLIQLGEGNSLSADVQNLVSSGVLSVIQNSLDNQKIGNVTGLNVEVNNFKNIVMPDLGRMIDFEITRSLDSVQ